VGDLDRVQAFYAQVLEFTPVTESVTGAGAADAWLDLADTRLRRAKLRLGDESITLTQHTADPGRPIPPDSRSHDHWFQHIAIVVSDMDRAYERLRQARVRHVSTAPQTLPAWNREAGGIRAFYFRDPEDHVLEVIWFPPGKGDPRWQTPPDQASHPSRPLFLGIDHTAIVVADTERSLAFYRDTLGMRVAGMAENHGSEQEHLNQVFGARVRITSLRDVHGPGIEFLEYIAPPGGRSLPADARANDLVFWHATLLVDALPRDGELERNAGTRIVSREASQVAWQPTHGKATSRSKDSSPGTVHLLVRDPDGHALDFQLNDER